MSEVKEITPGKYRHYKGNEYEVFDVATHSEDDSIYVVYRPLYGDRALWIRPFEMFIQSVDVDGKSVPRFEYLGEMPEDEL